MKSLSTIFTCLFLFVVLSGCSGDEKKEKTTVQKQMEQVGHNAAEGIKADLKKAEDAAQLQEAHNKQIEEAIKN